MKTSTSVAVQEASLQNNAIASRQRFVEELG
jgi:hypothetical protein